MDLYPKDFEVKSGWLPFLDGIQLTMLFTTYYAKKSNTHTHYTMAGEGADISEKKN